MTDESNVTSISNDAFLVAQFARWDELNEERAGLSAEIKRVNDLKAAILDDVEAKGVDRDSFKFHVKHRKVGDDRQRKLKLGFENCESAEQSIPKGDEVAEG